MNQNERDVQPKLSILRHADQIGDVCETCRYFDIARGELLSSETSLTTVWKGRPGKSQTGAEVYLR